MGDAQQAEAAVNWTTRANDGNSDDNHRARDRRWRQYRRVVTVDDIDGRRSNGYIVIMFIRICVDLLGRQCDDKVYGVGVTTPKPSLRVGPLILTN